MTIKKPIQRSSLCLFAMFCILTTLVAEDWPEWRGKGRLGVWNESGILDSFPPQGLKALWRTPVHAGFAGPAVAAGRVFVTDFESSSGPKGTERVLCLDEKSGKILWTRAWNANYGKMSYAFGPRATPTVDGERVFVLGATGMLLCLKVKSGDIIWQKDFAKDYGMQLPIWGITSAPLIDGNRLIAIVGGQPDAKVMAFDKITGKEIWRALSSDSEQGYCQPIIFKIADARQLIIWHPTAVASLDPVTGKVLWQQPFTIKMGMTLATPVLSGSNLLVSAFYNGSMLLNVLKDGAKMLWKGKSDSEINTDGLHAVINTPVIDGDYIYGICSYGQFRCLNLKTGERVWETMDVTKERARWASGLIVRQGDRYFINNDRGELIIAKLSPERYQEICRTQLIKPTTNPGNRRELEGVNWSHPAYANHCIFARNDEEIIAVSLKK
jgi:outer membrane protein assembly factor BamB